VSPPSFAVVICAYTGQRWDQICEAVASVRAQTLVARQVVVVVDHNPALLAAATKAFTDATVVANSGQPGLSAARNTGIGVAEADVVAFLDDDAVAEPDWLRQLSVGYEREEVLGVGGTVDPWWPVDGPGWFPAEYHWVVGCSYLGLPVTDGPVRNFIGANMSFRRSVFDAAGGFRCDIGRVGARPLGCEETEFCIRARRVLPGAVFQYRPAARVRHRVGPERCTWSYFRSRCYAEGLSKAVVARAAGRSPALAAERAYVTATLPRGVARAARDALAGDLVACARALAIVAGLLTTSAGYITGSVMADPTGSPGRRLATDRA